MSACPGVTVILGVDRPIGHATGTPSGIVVAGTLVAPVLVVSCVGAYALSLLTVRDRSLPRLMAR